MKRYGNGGRYVCVPFDKLAAVILFAVGIVAMAVLLLVGADDAQATDNREPHSVLLGQMSGHDIETRLLIAYLGRVHNDATDDFTLDTWEYQVFADIAPDGTVTGYYCDERGDELPSVRHLQAYLDLGGKVFEDGSCYMGVPEGQPISD